MKKILIIAVILLLIVILLIYFLGGFNTNLFVRNYNIKSSKINKKIKIAALTDLHSCYYGEEQIDLLDAIDKENPDIVVLVGDIVDERFPMFNAIKVADYLGSNYKTYYVSGNHEFKSKYPDYIKDMFTYYGVKVLEGSNEKIEINEDFINISGIDDYVIGKDIFKEQLRYANDSTLSDEYSMLLSHRPEFVEEYSKLDFDLVVSGHAHGGQWIIPGLLNGLLAPNQGLFPKYAGGLYEYERFNHVVSRGLAKESTRFIPRIFNPPELVIIEIEGSRDINRD